MNRVLILCLVPLLAGCVSIRPLGWAGSDNDALAQCAAAPDVEAQIRCEQQAREVSRPARKTLRDRQDAEDVIETLEVPDTEQ